MCKHTCSTKKTNSCRLQDCRYSVGALFGGCEDRVTFIARLRLRHGYPRQLRASPPLRAPAGSRFNKRQPKHKLRLFILEGGVRLGKVRFDLRALKVIKGVKGSRKVNCELIRLWRLDFLLARDSLQAVSPHCFVRQL